MTQWGLDTLFNPAKRHMDEEKRRLQSTREEIGDSSGGKRIDLESGKVTIRRQDASAPESGAAESPPEQAESAAEQAESPAKRSGRARDKPTPSPAAVRAARRRGRRPS